MIIIQEVKEKKYQYGLTRSELLEIFSRLRPVLNSARNRSSVMEKAA